MWRHSALHTFNGGFFSGDSVRGVSFLAGAFGLGSSFSFCSANICRRRIRPIRKSEQTVGIQQLSRISWLRMVACSTLNLPSGSRKLMLTCKGLKQWMYSRILQYPGQSKMFLKLHISLRVNYCPTHFSQASVLGDRLNDFAFILRRKSHSLCVGIWCIFASQIAGTKSNLVDCFDLF